MLDSILPTNADLYLTPRPQGEAKILPAPEVIKSLEKALQPNNTDSLSLPDKAKLLYYINKIIGVHCLWISPSVTLDILAIAHEEGHPGFSRCYKIIIRSWFI